MMKYPAGLQFIIPLDINITIYLIQYHVENKQFIFIFIFDLTYNR